MTSLGRPQQGNTGTISYASAASNSGPSYAAMASTAFGGNPQGALLPQPGAQLPAPPHPSAMQPLMPPQQDSLPPQQQQQSQQIEIAAALSQMQLQPGGPSASQQQADRYATCSASSLVCFEQALALPVSGQFFIFLSTCSASPSHSLTRNCTSPPFRGFLWLMACRGQDWKAQLKLPPADTRFKTAVSTGLARLHQGSQLWLQPFLALLASPAFGPSLVPLVPWLRFCLRRGRSCLRSGDGRRMTATVASVASWLLVIFCCAGRDGHKGQRV